MIRKWIKEIKKVGFRDWVWFVVYLRRDESSDKLDIGNYYPAHGWEQKLLHDRSRAHHIEFEIRN